MLEDTLQLTVHLVRVPDGKQLWREMLTQDINDFAGMERNLAARLIDILKLRLTEDEKRILSHHHSPTSQAYHAYLQGRYYRNQQTGRGLEKAIEFLQQTVEVDPQYALAYAGLAECYIVRSRYGSRPPSDDLSQARQMASKALGIDPTLAQAHAAVAYVRMHYDWNWVGAEEEFKRARDLTPNIAFIRRWYSELLSVTERHDEARAELERARELDPTSVSLLTQLAEESYYTRRYDLAIEQFRKVIAHDYTFAPAHHGLGLVYLRQGMVKEAIGAFQSAVTFSGRRTTAALLGHAHAVSGNQDQAKRILDNLIASSKTQYSSAYDIALVYAGLGETGHMFRWLAKAYEQRSLPPAFFKVDPLWDEFRPDPRFEALARQARFRH